MNSSNPTTLAKRRYVLELVLCMLAYAVILILAIWMLRHIPLAGPLRYVVALAPVVPVVFLWLAILRYWGATDELERRVILESLGVAGAITALLAVTYGFLEGVGFPFLSAWWTWAVFMGAWLVGRIFVSRYYER